MIPVLKPSCTDAEIAAVTEVLRSGWWGMGPKCAEFERLFAMLHGRRNCVTVNSATAALHLALLATGVGPGDEVIVPALTFVSTALAVMYCGARPVFADVRADTLTLDLDDVERKLTAKTAAVIPVDYAGYPAIIEGAYGVPVIQDAAHAAGGTVYGDLACFSFHPVKPLATGDGGAILTDSDETTEKLRRLRWCGIDRSTHERASGKRYGWDYDIRELGFKCHWNDVQAAIGLAQLGRLGEMQARRREIAALYSRLLRGVELPLAHPAHMWHLYAIRVRASKRDAIIDHLGASGVSAGVHYKPLTHYALFADRATPPVAGREWQRLISLPIFADMTDADVERVAALVNEVARA